MRFTLWHQHQCCPALSVQGKTFSAPLGPCSPRTVVRFCSGSTLITEEESNNRKAVHPTVWLCALPDKRTHGHYPLGTSVKYCQESHVVQGMHFLIKKKTNQTMKESNLESSCFSLGSHLTTESKLAWGLGYISSAEVTL